MKPRAALFDVDGVLAHSPKPFSHIYAEKYGLDTRNFERFFRGDFLKALVGQADLKDLIIQHRKIWKFSEPEEILSWWFEAENNPDYQLLQLIEDKRSRGLQAFITTDQEKYRAKYIYEEMFPNLFDGIFASSDLGYRKEEYEYWRTVIKKLGGQGVSHSAIVYFDDGENNIKAAQEAGVRAYLYSGVNQVREILG